MTVPFLTYAQLKDQLGKFGYFEFDHPQATEFFDLGRIIYKKEDYKFPLQYRDKYFYTQVVPLFQSLGIDVPEDHQLCYDQHMEMAKKMEEEAKKKKESEKVQPAEEEESGDDEEKTGINN